MWVYLAAWLVQDGSLPWLQRGQRLLEVGLVANAWSVEPSDGPDGVAEQEGPDPDGDPMRHSNVTGTVEWSRMYRRAGSCMVLRVDDFRLFVEPVVVMERPAVPAEKRRPWWVLRRTTWKPTVRRRALDFPPPGSRVTIHCSLWVAPDYRLDEVREDAPNVRADWIVVQIQMALRERVWHGEPGREWAKSGQIVSVKDIDRMQWDDDDDEDLIGVYQLDLGVAAR